MSNPQNINQQLFQMAVSYADFIRETLRDKLKAVVLFGSVSRNEANGFSDVDLLVIADPLPTGRFQRQAIFQNEPVTIKTLLDDLHEKGIHADVTVHIKTASEINIVTPFLFEIVHDGMVLYDTGFFMTLKNRVNQIMQRLGVQWKYQGKHRYLDYKPDYQWGEVFEL